MKQRSILWQAAGFAAATFGGTILHFLYDWTGGSILVSPFSGVNESTWEHMKLLYWPLFLFALVQRRFFRDHENYWYVKLAQILLGLTLIPVLFYTYNGVFGQSPDWINIAIFYLTAALVFLFERWAFKQDRHCKSQQLAFAAICLLGVLFVLFTFKTPQLPLFQDPLTGTFGLQAQTPLPLPAVRAIMMSNRQGGTPMKVYEGSILTCDGQDRVCRYLVEDGGRIVFVGDELPAKFASFTRVKLGGRALIPAFGDSHIHFASFATFHAGLNVSDARSNAEILEMIRAFVPICGDKMVIAFGASPHSVAEKKFVTRRELDEVCPDKPLFMIKYDGHTCVVNTKLLDILNEKVRNLRGYHEDTGEMNQEAFFAFSDYVSSSIPPLKLIRNMQLAADHLASRGIGMIHSVSGVGYTMDLDVDMENWFAKGLGNGLQMRVYFQTMDVQKARRRRLTRIGGCFDAALDGCFGSADAALLQPYEGTDDTGVLYYTDEQVAAFCKKANREGMQIELHAIGDAAFDQAARALNAALDEYPRKNHRHTIIHACLPTEEGIRICAEYGIALAIQSAFIDWPNEPNEYLESILGGRAAKLNPFKTYADHGIVQSLGSDGPCTDPDPIIWIHKACNNGAQSVTVQQALKMCTCNTCWMSFDETERGSLEAGKIADMVILSGNPYEMDVRKLDTLKVEQLLLQGEPYRKITQNPIGQVLKGLVQR